MGAAGLGAGQFGGRDRGRAGAGIDVVELDVWRTIGRAFCACAFQLAGARRGRAFRRPGSPARLAAHGAHLADVAAHHAVHAGGSWSPARSALHVGGGAGSGAGQSHPLSRPSHAGKRSAICARCFARTHPTAPCWEQGRRGRSRRSDGFMPESGCHERRGVAALRSGHLGQVAGRPGAICDQTGSSHGRARTVGRIPSGQAGTAGGLQQRGILRLCLDSRRSGRDAEPHLARRGRHYHQPAGHSCRRAWRRPGHRGRA